MYNTNRLRMIYAHLIHRPGGRGDVLQLATFRYIAYRS